jgi:ABC-type branched-subunit amino acid transport system substrate-binding protein
VLGEDGMRGFEVALREWSKTAGGRALEIIIASTDASPDSAVRAARKLVEQDRVDVVISPLSGFEGIAIRDYAKTQPDMTFIKAASGARETTFVDPAEKFFRFNMDGAQRQAGLGDYIYNDKGYRTITTVGEDYSFVCTQVFGLVLEFCAAGGEVTERFWVPLGTKDFASIIAALPDDVDAIYLGLGGGDAVNFLHQYVQGGRQRQADRRQHHGRSDRPLVQGSGEGGADRHRGRERSGGHLGQPKWQAFVKAYQDAFPSDQRFAGPRCSPPTDLLPWRPAFMRGVFRVDSR